MLELVECKFARNGFTNLKTFLTNIFENIIWHLFAGESHQVVKITVPQCAGSAVCLHLTLMCQPHKKWQACAQARRLTALPA